MRELYVLFDDDIGRMKLEFWGRSRVFIHYLAKGTPFKVARRALRMFPYAKSICKALGYRWIDALFRDSVNLERFCVLNGFKLVRKQEGLTYMRCGNA